MLLMQIRDVPVVGVTCLSVARSPILRSRLFDVCILDEASQVTLPASLGPLLRCRTFVLVGDHLQLPPLVQSARAQVCACLGRGGLPACIHAARAVYLLTENCAVHCMAVILVSEVCSFWWDRHPSLLTAAFMVLPMNEYCATTTEAGVCFPGRRSWSVAVRDSVQAATRSKSGPALSAPHVWAYHGAQQRDYVQLYSASCLRRGC